MRSLLPLLVTAALPAVVQAQAASRPTIVDTYGRARRALDSTIAHHGGPEAIRESMRLRLTVQGYDFARNQSRRADGPLDRLPFTGTLSLDAPAQRMVWDSRSEFIGGFRNASRTVIDSARGFNVNLRQNVWFPAPNRTIPAQRGIVNRSPQLLLASALENIATARWLGAHRLTSGALVDVVMLSTPNGALNLGLDPRTRELRASLGVQADAIVGDAPAETEFTQYTRQGRQLVPGRLVSRVAGVVVQDLRYRDVAFGGAVPDSLLAPPTGSTQAPPNTPGEPVRELAPGVWAIRAGGWALAVTLGEEIAVIEAGQGGAAEIMDRLTRLAPGKRVRWIVPTHHHDDHSGSVPAYLAAGATLVTTPGNTAYFARMARAKSTLRPPLAPGATMPAGPPRIETFTGTRTLGGAAAGTRTVELHDIGPSPHAQEMLVAWLPAEGILFQGDLLNLPAVPGFIPPGMPLETMTHFRDWTRAKGWTVKTLVGTHMAPGAMAQLDEAIAKAGPR